MFTEGRVTRSRARTESHTRKTPGTRSRTARKATEASAPRAALFDVTNATEEEPAAPPTELPPLDETKPVEFEQEQPSQEEAPVLAAEAAVEPAVVPAAVAEQQQEEDEIEAGETVQIGAPEEALAVVESVPEVQEEEQALAAEESMEAAVVPEPAEEPPATPPHAPLPSPTPAAVAPTPTGLGLSSLEPTSPLGPTILLSANTPAVTPLHGVPAAAAQQANVYDTLQAAAQVFAQQQEHKEKEEADSKPAAGFGSPVKYSESPAMSVSIAGAISERDAMEGVEEECDEVCSGSPGGIPSPGMDLSSQAVPEELSGPSPGPVSLMPAEQSPAAPVDLAVEEAQPVKEEEEQQLAAPVEQAAAPKPRLQSKVVASSPYDPRSLRQLRAEIKQKGAEKVAASAANSEEEEEEYYGEEEEQVYDYEGQGGDELLGAMGALNLGSPGVAPLGPYDLHGVPKPCGQHIRFNDDGSEYVSPRLKTLLRGMPTPHGKHVFFEDDDE